MAYIDVDNAVEIGYLSDWYQASIDDTKPPIWTDEHLEELTNDFIVIPKDTPTSDVAEVKHGQWTYKEIFGIEFPECSVCGTQFEDANCGDYPYCPECGAKMDGTPKERGGEK